MYSKLNIIPDVSESTPDTNCIVQREHFAVLDLPVVYAPVELLIGTDTITRFPISEVRLGNSTCPFTSRPVLGWMLDGPGASLILSSHSLPHCLTRSYLAHLFAASFGSPDLTFLLTGLVVVIIIAILDR